MKTIGSPIIGMTSSRSRMATLPDELSLYLRQQLALLLASTRRNASASMPAASDVSIREDTTSVMCRSRKHTYQLIGPIGNGGTAMVYRAMQLETGKAVALKIFDAAYGEELYYREASFHQLLQPHSSILAIVDAGFSLEGRYYIASPLMVGTLASKIRNQRLTLAQALAIANRIALALQHMHTHGVIHRDVKPMNVLLDSNGLAYLSDFGLAKYVGEQTRHTRQGYVVGTSAYLSPEQVVAAPNQNERIDIYQLGVLLFELLLGRPPFVFKASKTTDFFSENMHSFYCEAHLNCEPPRLPESFALFRPIMETLLAKNPSERPATAGEVVVQLRQIEPLLPPMLLQSLVCNIAPSDWS